MYTMENYLWGGVAYLCGVLLLLPMLWSVTRFWPWAPLRAFFRILVLAVLLTPIYPYSDKPYLAPAWAAAAFEYVNPITDEGALRGLLPIGFCFAVAYVLYLIIWLLWRRWRRPSTG